MKAIDILRVFDQLFYKFDIYPPLMKEVSPGQWAGDVSDEEYVVFTVENENLVGISYDGHQFGTLEAFEQDLPIIHDNFKNKKRYRAEEITPDRVIMVDIGY